MSRVKELVAFIIVVIVSIFSIYLLVDMVHWVWLGKERVERTVYACIDKGMISEEIYKVLKKERVLEFQHYHLDRELGSVYKNKERG